jgi:glycosyltransferase involved in cell wall biosynthesis
VGGEVISIVLPAYNEAAHIESNVLEVVDTFSSLNYDFEVIVVDDGSPDSTYLSAVRAKSSHPEKVRVVRYDVNRGKGNALVCGACYARGDLIAFLDADMDLHPSQLPVLIEQLEATGVDVVIGSKRHPASNVDYPRHRWVLSWGFFVLIRMFFGLPLRDTQTGIKVFRREVVEAVFPLILAKRFAFDVEVLAVAHHLGFKISDAPITLRFGRKFSRIRPYDVFYTMRDTLAIFYRLRLRRYYDQRGRELREQGLSPSREVHSADDAPEDSIATSSPC